jgi:MFS family permease
LALLGTAFFMVTLDGTIVYVALPLIQDALGLSTGGVQWVMSAYLLCFGKVWAMSLSSFGPIGS